MDRPRASLFSTPNKAKATVHRYCVVPTAPGEAGRITPRATTTTTARAATGGTTKRKEWKTNF